MELDKIPQHLRCDSEDGSAKPKFKPQDFKAEQEFFCSYPLVDQDNDKEGKNFPGMLVKTAVRSVDWSRIAQAEDRWIYKPKQGIVRFGCFTPQEALNQVLQEQNLNDKLAYSLAHEPVRHSSTDDENYSHCHLEFWKDAQLVEDEKAFLKSMGLPFKLVFRRLIGKKMAYRRNPEDEWHYPENG